MRVRFPIDTAGPSARALAAIVFHGMGHYDWISFTTDYGLCDCFVASCHGVIARLSPNVRIIDITHDIPPGDVRRGAHVLAEAVEHLPVSVHLAVVDPGVGTDRRAIAVQTPGGILVGPDNGLLPEAADRLGGITDVVELTTTAWFAPRVSPTFHGRDIFAPVAARLARGADLAEAGREVDPASLVRFPPPVVVLGDHQVSTEIRAVDRFGNVQLAVQGDVVSSLGSQILIGSMPVRWVTTFGDAPKGSLIIYIDSAGYASIAVNAGRASDALAVRPGDHVHIAGV